MRLFSCKHYLYCKSYKYILFNVFQARNAPKVGLYFPVTTSVTENSILPYVIRQGSEDIFRASITVILFTWDCHVTPENSLHVVFTNKKHKLKQVLCSL